MKYAMQAGSSSIMLDCASYFEGKQEYDKAVQLYHKGGDLPRALDLCFRAAADFAAESNSLNNKKTMKNSSNANSASNSPQAAAMFEMINVIAADLGENSSPQTLSRCADFLVQNKQFPKVVGLLCMARMRLILLSIGSGALCASEEVLASNRYVSSPQGSLQSYITIVIDNYKFHYSPILQ